MKQFFKFLFASILGFFISAALIIVFFITLISVTLSSKDKAVSVKNNSVLVFDLNQIVLERPDNDLSNKIAFFGGKMQKTLTLNALLAAIKKAKNDTNIKGIYIKGSGLSTPGLATFQEIHNALNDFKTSKKFVVAYSEQYSLMGYYLASTANQVYLNPIGNIDFKGLASSVTFFKNAMDKLGVEAQIIRVGKYKSAVEPFILTEMSPANREQTSAFLNSIHQNILRDISQNQKITVDSLANISNNLSIKNAEDALKFKLITGLKYQDEMLETLKSLLKVGKEENPNSISINDYLNTLKSDEKDSKNQIAIVYVNGEIVNGNSTEGSSGNVTEALHKARENKEVKAVVLRVNSPGGSGLASDIIWREISLLRQMKKPVYVSMGDYAASGGYYVSCNADMIFAQPNTITGSIGVFGILPNAQKLLNDKIGVNFDVVKTGKFSDMGAFYRPLSNEESTILQNEVNDFYSKFIHKVAEGRHKSDASVDSIASGRVWAGNDALKLGLVDKIGSFRQTIEAVAEKAKLKDYEIVEFQKTPNLFETLLNESTNSIKTYTLKSELGELFPYYQQLKMIGTQKGIMARMPFGNQITY